MCTQTTISRSGGCSRHRLHSSGVLWRPPVSTVSFSAVARLLAREQLPRHLLHKSLLLAPQRKRSSAPDPACEANAEDTVRIQRVRFFFEYLPYSQVCAHEVHGWALESGKAGGFGDNSSWCGGSSTYPRSSSSCVLLALRPNEPGASTRRARHSTLCLSSST